MKKSVRFCDADQLEFETRRCQQQLLLCLHEFADRLESPSLSVPLLDEVNPPLWDFGHVAWFTEYWITRNSARHEGVRQLTLERSPSVLKNADHLFNSATIAHADRWQLDLLGVDGIREYLVNTFNSALNSLKEDRKTDSSLYFHRLCLAHAWMHIEAFQMNAQTLGIPLLTLQRSSEGAAVVGKDSLFVSAQTVQFSPDKSTFHFDNEADALTADMNAFEIDFRPISVSRYWEFVEHEGYLQRRLWSDEGWAWRQKSGAEAPLHFLKSEEGFRHRMGDHWQAVKPDAPAIHLSFFEAQAWCNWAGRRLPSEAEWMAAVDAGVEWGKVWEWTSSTFGPFPGFSPHPYQEYSKPWFKGHWVLKGASTMTNDLLRDPLLRNFYRPQRRDVFAGFRSVRAGN